MKRQNLKIGNKYIVKWIDIFSESGWFDKEEIIKRSKVDPIESLGYYFGKRNGFLILSRDCHDDEDFDKWGDPTFIPLGCVKSIKPINNHDNIKRNTIN